MDLGKQDAAADGVKQSRRDVEDVARLGRDGVEDLGKASLTKGSFKLGCRNPLLHPPNDRGTRLGVKDDPDLGFAVRHPKGFGVGIARMHLHRELIPCVDQLDQKREIGEARMIPDGGEVLRESHAACLSVCYEILVSLSAREHPRLSDALIVRADAVLLTEAPAAPDGGFCDRHQLDRIALHLVGSFCFSSLYLRVTSLSSRLYLLFTPFST